MNFASGKRDCGVSRDPEQIRIEIMHCQKQLSSVPDLEENICNDVFGVAFGFQKEFKEQLDFRIVMYIQNMKRILRVVQA
jgi:hypothetical protein